MWIKNKIDSGDCFRIIAGKNTCHLSKFDEGWLFHNVFGAEFPSNPLSIEKLESSPELSWKKILGGKGKQFITHPALPDRPIVIKPSETFYIMPKASVWIYVNIPLWLQFYENQANASSLIAESASIQLSSTWYGEPDNGILAYALQKGFDTQVDEYSNPYHIICPVKVVNLATERISVSKLLVHTEFSSIFEINNKLFCNAYTMELKGDNMIVDVDLSTRAPEFLGKATKVVGPRNPEKNNLIKKGYNYLKFLTNY